jgi:hypothetical protein
LTAAMKKTSIYNDIASDILGVERMMHRHCLKLKTLDDLDQDVADALTRLKLAAADAFDAINDRIVFDEDSL